MMNIQKFLGIRDPKTPYKKGTFVDQSKQYSPRVGRKVTQTTSLKALMSIRTKVLSIENTLKDILTTDKKTLDHKKRVLLVREQDKRSKRASATQPLIGGIIRPPRMGILDAIKNFVLFTFLGWLSQFILPHIDKLKPVVEFFGKALEIFDFVFKHILGGIGNMIKFGYDTWDMITGKVDDIKKAGSDIQNVFDDTLTALAEVMGGTIEIATSFLENSGVNVAEQISVADDVDVLPPLPELPSADSVASASPQISSFPQIQTFQSGGRIDPTTPITRGIQTEEDKRRTILTPPTVQQQQTVPGRDVGGEEKVKELYGSQDRDGFFGFRLFAGTQERDAFSGLTRASFELKQPRSDDFLGLGNLMGASVDIALGQKPERRTYQQFAEGIKYLIDYRLAKPDEFEKINLERMIEKMVETKVDSAINKIREEIAKRSTTTTPGFDIGGFSFGIAGGEYGGFAPTGIERQIYDYLINEKRLSDNHALGLMANIHRESSFRPNARERGGTGIGLFQWSHGRVRPFIQAVPDWETNWKAQIDYALREPENLSMVKPGTYESKEFSSPQEAADWWMREWERPRDTASGSRKHTQYLQNVPRAPEGTAQVRGRQMGDSITMVSPGQFRPIEGTSGASMGRRPLAVPYSPFTSEQGNPIITSGFGRRWGRDHRGIDIGAAEGTPLYAYISGVVTASNSGHNGGYGNQIEWRDANGVIHSFSHLRDRPTLRVGDRVTKGQLVGRVGSTGSSDGPHLHWEIRVGGVHQDPVEWTRRNPLPEPVTQTLAMKGGKEGVIMNGRWEERAWTPEERQRFNQQKQSQSQPATQELSVSDSSTRQPSRSRKGSRSTREQIINSVNIDGQIFTERRLADGSSLFTKNGQPISEEIYRAVERNFPTQFNKMRKGGLVFSNNQTSLNPPETYASYNKPSPLTKVFIQPVMIQEVIPASVPPSIKFPTPRVNSSSNASLTRN